jgi:hypothetical protein
MQKNKKDVISGAFCTSWEATSSSCMQKNKKDVISGAFCTSWEATSSSRNQQKGCDIWRLLYFLGGHVIFPQAIKRI